MVGIIALLIGQWVTNAFTQTVLDRRAAAKSKPPTPKTATPKPRRTAREVAARIIPTKTRLLTKRQASYKSQITSGSIRRVPSVKWLSDQPVVCAHGHRSTFGLFASLPGYGTLNILPESDSRTHNRHGFALHRLGGAGLHNINDRDPNLDVRWQLGCPTCGTNLYVFEAQALREYMMCTTSPDLFWVFCHLYRRDSGICGNCELRRNYWTSLRSLE